MFSFLSIRWTVCFIVPWQENTKIKILSSTSTVFIFYIVAISRNRYSLVFCIKVVLRLDLVHSKYTGNRERIRRWIKSRLLSQLSRIVALWKRFYLTYNHFHDILRLFDVLPNFLFTISETMRNYYLYTWYMRVASCFAQPLKT